MAKQRVSSDFAKWQERSTNKLAESKKAENTMGGIPFPVGHTGVCTVIDMTAGVTKNKNIPYMTIKCASSDGKKFSKMYMFSTSEKATFADRWSWMLNEFENAGMPREFREEHGDSAESLINYFLGEEEIKMSFEVVADTYQQSGRNIRFGMPDGVAQLEKEQEGTFATSPEEVVPDVLVMWNDTAQRVLKVEGDQVTVKSTTTNNQRTLNMDDLSF